MMFRAVIYVNNNNITAGRRACQSARLALACDSDVIRPLPRDVAVTSRQVQGRVGSLAKDATGFTIRHSRHIPMLGDATSKRDHVKTERSIRIFTIFCRTDK